MLLKSVWRLPMPKEGYPQNKQLFITCPIKTGLCGLDVTCWLQYLHAIRKGFDTIQNLFLLLCCLIRNDILISVFFSLRVQEEESVNICTAGRTPGMLSHTKDFNLEYRGERAQVFWYSCIYRFESTAALHEQTPPKRITENPSLIHWSIHMTSTVQCQRQVTQRTCHPESGQSEYHAGFMVCSGSPHFNLCFFTYTNMSASEA